MISSNKYLASFAVFASESPFSKNSSILTRVQAGTPVNVLKVWDSEESGQWLLVNVISQNFYQLFYKRGWVNIESS